MTLASLLLVVLASVIHASWNLLAKRAASVGPLFILAYSLVACIAYAPWVLYRLVQDDAAWTLTGIGFVLLSGLVHLGYSLCLQRGYQKADLSVVYPVARGTGPLLSTLGAIFILGEVPTAQGLLGLALVVAGIALIATDGDPMAFRRPGGRSGIHWGTTIGGLIAAYTVVDAHAVKTLGIAPIVLDWLANLLRLMLLAPLAIASPDRARKAMQGSWGIAIAVGLLSPLSYILVLTALMAEAPLSLVAPMREMSMMVGALMGMLILGEKVGPWRLAGCGILITGVVLLSTA